MSINYLEDIWLHVDSELRAYLIHSLIEFIVTAALSLSINRLTIAVLAPLAALLDLVPAPLVDLLFLKTELPSDHHLLFLSPQSLTLLIHPLQRLELLTILPHSLLVSGEDSSYRWYFNFLFR